MSDCMLIMGKGAKIDPTLRKETMAFLEKLTTDDSAPGLHIEPIKNSADTRVRTGRVTLQFRAVLFRLTEVASRAYVFVGVWNHDDAIERARKAKMTVNPVNGITEIRYLEDATPPAVYAPPTAAPKTSDKPTLLGHTAAELREGLGIEAAAAEAAALITSEDDLMDLVEGLPEWQGMALLDLAGGTSAADVKAKLSISSAVAPVDREITDATLLAGLRHPAARMTYAFIEDNVELRRIIEGGDFDAWRTFLHPEQDRYVAGDYKGAYRLTGGAGTGKTVVLVHRARRLAKARPEARILLTTFTTNLADDLGETLRRLDPDLPQVSTIGSSGVWATGIDALASAVLKQADPGDLAAARQELLGSPDGAITGRLSWGTAWRDAIDSAGQDVPEQLRTPAFFHAEYSMVVLPNRVITKEQYLRIRRPGRGVRLSRAERTAVWQVIEAFRISARGTGAIDFGEAAALAALHLERQARAGTDRLFDHVLVDEGQDLSPAQWQLIRALVSEGPNDVFIAEDSHQRIYGQRLVLSRYGFKITGRSRRLTLNYRTTAQNLKFAVDVLEHAHYSDLEDEGEISSGYRSARTGPRPKLLPCASMADEFDQAATIVRDWEAEVEAEGLPSDSIAILVRDRYQRDRVVAGLAERGVTARAVDRGPVPTGDPVVMTMHRAKGTEFVKVLLFGVSDKSVPKTLSDYDYSDEEKADALLRERSLLYVAATRARDELAVSWSSTASNLLPTSG